MKYLKMFEAITGLFPRMIKVTLLNAITGQLIGRYKIPAEQLPNAFNRPTIIELDNIKWRVLQADKILADDFLFTKKLTLHVQDAAAEEEGSLLHTLPTKFQHLPPTGLPYLEGSFTLELASDDWQQIEFRPLSSASSIEQEITKINEILTGQSNPLLGYREQYIRQSDSLSALGISYQNFCGQVNKVQLGNVYLRNHGFVSNGFALQTSSYTYYGVAEDDRITSLCVTRFDFVDDEFMQVVNMYELLLVDWCEANILSMSYNEAEEDDL